MPKNPASKSREEQNKTEPLSQEKVIREAGSAITEPEDIHGPADSPEVISVRQIETGSAALALLEDADSASPRQAAAILTALFSRTSGYEEAAVIVGMEPYPPGALVNLARRAISSPRYTAGRAGCFEDTDELADFASNGMDISEAAAMAIHIAICAECGRIWNPIAARARGPYVSWVNEVGSNLCAKTLGYEFPYDAKARLVAAQTRFERIVKTEAAIGLNRLRKTSN
jgi:hypothetical protein